MTGLCKGYAQCYAPPTCYSHYDSLNDCYYNDHTPNTESVTVTPYAPSSFVCPDGTTQTGINAVVACENHGLTSGLVGTVSTLVREKTFKNLNGEVETNPIPVFIMPVLPSENKLLFIDVDVSLAIF